MQSEFEARGLAGSLYTDFQKAGTPQYKVLVPCIEAVSKEESFNHCFYIVTVWQSRLRRRGPVANCCGLRLTASSACIQFFMALLQPQILALPAICRNFSDMRYILYMPNSSPHSIRLHLHKKFGCFLLF